MIITIPFKTPTINHLYWHRGNMKIMTKDAKEIRKEIAEICSHYLDENIIPIQKKLKVDVKIYEDWLCKDGSVKRKDIANREKFIIDSIFNALGIDDKFIFKHTMEKIQSDQEKCVVQIEVLE